MDKYVNLYISSLCNKSLEKVNWNKKKAKTLCINVLSQGDLDVLKHFKKPDILYNNEKLFFQNLHIVKQACSTKSKIFADNENIRKELVKYRPNLPYFNNKKEQQRQEQQRQEQQRQEQQRQEQQRQEQQRKEQQCKEQQRKERNKKYIYSKWNRNPNIIKKYGLIKEETPKNLYNKEGIVIVYDYLGKDIENNLIQSRLKNNLRTWIIGRDSDYDLSKIPDTQKLFVDVKILDKYKNSFNKNMDDTFKINDKIKDYIITLLGYNKIKEDGSRHTNWFPWNRFLDVYKTLGYKCEWTSLEELKRTDEKRLFITWNEPTSLELYQSGKLLENDIIFQKLTSLGKGMEGENWTDNPKEWCKKWNWPIYRTVEHLYDLGLNIYAFGCKTQYDEFPEKKRICEKLKDRIHWISWGGTPFNWEQIKNAKPVMNNLTEDISFVGSKWGKVGRGNIDAWEKYLKPMENNNQFKFNQHGGIGNKMVTDNEMIEILQKSKICPIIHAPSWQAERGIQDRFYSVFLSGRFGICDNLGAIDIFGDEIKDICTEDPKEYFEKSIYFLKHPEKQLKYIEIIQKKIKEEFNFYRQWENIFYNIYTEPSISFYMARNEEIYRNSGINKICNYIFDNIGNYLKFNIINNYKKSSDIVVSTYDELDKNYNRCRILIVHDLIYLYNKNKLDTIGQFNRINNILSTLKKDDFIIFTTEYQQNKYLENKNKYNFQVSKENTDILYLPYRFKKNYKFKENSKKYDFFVLIQYSKRKNPDLYQKYIDELKQFKFCIILSNQKNNIENYIKIYENKNNVDLFYNIDDNEFLELILQSKYCLYLTDDEGTGLHAIECIYQNCIPIVKNNISFNELLGDNCYYLNDIYDVDKSIIQINNIVKNNKKSVNLDSDIFKKFNIDFCCKQLKEIINNFYKKYNIDKIKSKSKLNNLDENNTILYYVGYTCSLEFNTGIQKLVRYLSVELNKKKKIILIKYNNSKNDFEVINDYDLQMYLKYGGINHYEGGYDFHTLSIIYEKIKNKRNILIIPEICITRMEYYDLFYKYFKLAKDRKYIITHIFHDDILYNIPAKDTNIKKMMFNRYMRILSLADNIIPNSKYSEECYKFHRNRLNINYYQNINYLRLGVIDKLDRIKLFDNKNLDSNFIISNINSSDHKNSKNLIESFKLLHQVYPSLKLIIFGNHWKNNFDKDNNIETKYFVSNEEKDYLFKNCLFSVFPSVMEGFGFPIYESLIYNKPVICHNKTSTLEIADIINQPCVSAVNCKDINSLFEKMKQFCDKNFLIKAKKSISNVKFKTFEDYGNEFYNLINNKFSSLKTKSNLPNICNVCNVCNVSVRMGDLIDCISFLFSDGKNINWGNPTGGKLVDTFELYNGEYIVGISGNSDNNKLYSFRIHINTGRETPLWGNSRKGKEFKMQSSLGNKVIGIEHAKDNFSVITSLKCEILSSEFNRFVNNIYEFTKSIKYYKDLDKICLIIIPQFELVPYANLILNDLDKEKKKIILLNNPLKENIINYFSSQKEMICYCSNFMKNDTYNNVFKQIDSNNIKIDTLIFHNFSIVMEYAFNFFFNKYNNIKSSKCNIIFYSDGSRNNYKSESKDQCQIDFHTKLNNKKIANTLYFFGFVHNSYNIRKNYKLLNYKIDVYPKLSLSKLKITQNIGIILMRYLTKKGSPYQFNENINSEKIILKQLDELFDYTTENYIKFDRRFPENLNKSILTKKYKNFNDIFLNSGLETELFETILLNNKYYLSKIKKIYSFDSSFPLLFQIPELYDNLHKDISIYVGFSMEIFKSVSSKECIDTLIFRTIELVTNINKLNLFDIYLKDKLVNFDYLKNNINYDDYLFKLKKIK